MIFLPSSPQTAHTIERAGACIDSADRTTLPQSHERLWVQIVAFPERERRLNEERRLHGNKASEERVIAHFGDQKLLDLIDTRVGRKQRQAPWRNGPGQWSACSTRARVSNNYAHYANEGQFPKVSSLNSITTGCVSGLCETTTRHAPPQHPMSIPVNVRRKQLSSLAEAHAANQSAGRGPDICPIRRLRNLPTLATSRERSYPRVCVARRTPLHKSPLRKCRPSLSRVMELERTRWEGNFRSEYVLCPWAGAGTNLLCFQQRSQRDKIRWKRDQEGG